MKLLDKNIKANFTKELTDKLTSKVVGQPEGIEAICEFYQLYKTNLITKNKPISNMLIVGPTGTGKTRLIESFAESIFGSDKAMIKVDCGEFQHSHEISKLIGSPPGYLGHRETNPILSSKNIEQHKTEKNNFSIILFDEIEKSSDSLWNLLLGILDKGYITLGDNSRVDMTSTFIFMTSNIGAQKLSQLKNKRDLGYVQGEKNKSTEDIKKFTFTEVKKKFTPEFINRLDKIIHFNELKDSDYAKILDIELSILQDLVMNKTKQNIFIQFTDMCKEHILLKSINKEYGARDLKRIIDKTIKIAISNLIASKQIQEYDILSVDYTDDFMFYLMEPEDIV